MLDKKVPIFSITRDYISRLKTGVNHIASTESKLKFKNFSLKDEISFPQIYYRGAYKNKPDINILKGNNFSLMWGDLGGLGLRLKWLKNAISKVYFIPIDAISGERAFYTFMQLSKILHFNLPQNSKAFSGKVNRYEGLIMLPCNLRVDTKDVDKHIQEIQVLITTYQLHPNHDNKLINIMNSIKVKAPQDNLVLYVKQEEFRVLMENKTLLRLLQEYFEKYFSALRGYIKNIQDNLFSEQDILNYFKNHPKLALEFKKQVQGDIEIIKSQSPHIIDSWKYYQEFLRICADANII
ncbi:DUF2972 domain-containing protein [Helicobacter apodemus]|uniref:DUF2972 domain-containing protein n=1 Tax=Helicobacter apodemus TaxID=135569 RepID=A0A2U8FFN9_9HELI|nr:DUF2972 domain-containing protein [Helicobacter apodemus]AWI34848.1 hypothetical protein CDV25_08785 [Helicobacter apodemus]